MAGGVTSLGLPSRDGKVGALHAAGLLKDSLGVGLLGGLLRQAKAEAAFVRANEVITRYRGTIQAREAFQKDSVDWAKESKQLEESLKELGKTAKPTEPKAVERAREMGSRLKALRDKGAQHDQELMAPVVAEVNSGIQKFAKKHGYKLMIGTLQGGVVLYGEESVDVTEALVQELNHP